MKKLLFVIFIAVLIVPLNALGILRVESIKELPETHMNLEVRDADGKFSPVLIVKTELRGLGFQNVSRPTKHAAEYIEGDHHYKFYMNDNQRVVKITHSDYEPLEVRLLADYNIEVHAQRVYEMVLTNVPEKVFISINVTVEPQNAKITIDDEYFNHNKANKLFIGKHNIQIVLDGYQTVSEEIFVSEEQTLFSYNLKELENVPIEIDSDPQGASVYIDDVKIGETQLSKYLLQGSYSIRIEKKDYETIFDTIDIQPPKYIQTYYLLTNIGSIIVNSEPENGLDIYINGENSLNKTPYSFIRKEPGKYKISAKSGFFETDEQTIDLKKGERKIVSLIPKPIYATLSINTHKNALVKINDVEQIQLQNIHLEPSVYQISASLLKAETLEKTLFLKRNQVETLDLYPQVSTGSIQIAVTPFDAEVKLTGDAGEHYTSKGMNKFENIPVGEYQIFVTHTNFMPKQKKVILSENAILKEEFELISYDATMLQKAHQFKKHKWISFGSGSALIAFGIISNFVADSYYSDYESSITTADAISNRDNYEKWDNYRDYSYYISIGPIVYSAYSWIMQSHYNKLARTRK
ncbi:MAG: PEGA domain-containing protein [Candidatus Cloacimonetes bacterium]|nr:PEGA domain-containing protein [Candidatus Cloacimonadota bacterium]